MGTAARALAYLALGYVAMLVEGALAFVLPAPRIFVAVPELALGVVTYLGLAGRGGAPSLVGTALILGYLRDLLLGAPRGVEALAFALCALAARAMHGRVFLERYGQLAVVAVAMSLLHACFVLVLDSGDEALAASLRPMPGLLLAALLVTPLWLRALRRLDQRLVPEQRGIRFDGDLGGVWR
jgi:rod shape-determining protein MreD